MADKKGKEENKRATSGGRVVTIRRYKAIAIRSIVCVCCCCFIRPSHYLTVCILVCSCCLVVTSYPHSSAQIRHLLPATFAAVFATGTPAKGDPLPKDRPACLLQRWPNSDGSETVIRCTFLPAIFAENEPPD